MAVLTYDAQGTMKESRAKYFEANAFGEDGGYSAKWVDFKFGPVPFPIPNTASRVRAVRYHDLHHIVTGYDTDTAGEFEISGWEIGAGCGSFLAAWVLNLNGLVAGSFWIPRRTFRAFVRGRRGRSLYGLPVEPMLDKTVGEMRATTGSDVADLSPTWTDRLLFAAALAAGVVVGTVFLIVAVPLVPFGIVALRWAKGR